MTPQYRRLVTLNARLDAILLSSSNKDDDQGDDRNSLGNQVKRGVVGAAAIYGTQNLLKNASKSQWTKDTIAKIKAMAARAPKP